jgi:phenylpyruvate tautomerase PptA (4-oxalocrotonate tautomerase family)
MPVITINALELTNDQKRTIAKEYTATLSKLTKVPEERIYVLFNDYPLNSIAAGGGPEFRYRSGDPQELCHQVYRRPQKS